MRHSPVVAPAQQSDQKNNAVEKAQMKQALANRDLG
jgi:hypothetical protein